MKLLLLLRHAKAVPSGDGDDHARDLARRGLKDSAWAGGQISAEGWRPDVALVSDAKRTQRTAEIAIAAMKPEPTLRLEPRLYEATPGTIIELIEATPPDVSCLLVVGHNPGMAETARHLARKGEANLRGRLAAGFPTATVAAIDLGDRWDHARQGGRLLALLSPG